MSIGTSTPPTTTEAPAAASSRVVTTSNTVLGDGTTFGSRSRSRWRAARWPILVLTIILVVAGLAALSRPPQSSTPLAPDNAGPNGSRAVAQVLEHQGVSVRYVTRVADAVGLAAADTTLLVTSDIYLTPDQIAALAATDADLVLIEPGDEMLDAATDGDALTGSSWSTTNAVRSPECDDPDAVAAEGIRSDGYGFIPTGAGAVVCFPSEAGSQDGGAYLVHEAERRVVGIDDASLLTNASVTEDGNAALVLRSLGHHEELTWLVPDLLDTASGDDPGQSGMLGMLPPWAGVVLLQLLVVALFAMVWRARRLGPLVTENLPVVVRSAEATRGRGRLYRRARARGHAAAGLRANTADRVAQRLGLPRSADAPALVDALVRATHRPAEQVAHLLYGPPPADDAALLELARHLDHLESEVFHP